MGKSGPRVLHNSFGGRARAFVLWPACPVSRQPRPARFHSWWSQDQRIANWHSEPSYLGQWEVEWGRVGLGGNLGMPSAEIWASWSSPLAGCEVQQKPNLSPELHSESSFIPRTARLPSLLQHHGILTEVQAVQRCQESWGHFWSASSAGPPTCSSQGPAQLLWDPGGKQ